MKITNILTEDLVRINLPGASKDEIIENLIAVAVASDKVKDKEKVRQAILDREKIMSTGVGKGFAIPHGKTDSISDILAAFAVTAEPIDYESLDNEPVRLIFLLVGKENLVGTHIKYLSRISRLMNKDEFRDRLLASSSAAEVIELFREEEQQFPDA